MFGWKSNDMLLSFAKQDHITPRVYTTVISFYLSPVTETGHRLCLSVNGPEGKCDAL